MLQRLLLALLLVGTAFSFAPADASAQYFGRNKVQYRPIDFQIIRTEHFDVYFYEEEREAALDAARMAERAYARLSRLLQHEFKEKKPIIVYASHAEFQQTNTIADFLPEGTGAFAEMLKGRVVIPLTGSYAEFDHVLRHELVHSFQHDIILRNAALNNANPFATQLPLWFMEGMAEYLSIGHIDAITAAWLRDASLTGYLRTIGEMNRMNDYLSYRFGQALWAYIGSKWGDEVVGILLQRATRVGLERAFALTLGMSLAELSQEWTAEVRRTYLPQVAEFDRPEHFAEPVLRHEDIYNDPSYLAPAISPDGKLMAVFSTREGFFPDLWLVDAETGEFKRRLVESSRESDFESLRYQSSSAAFSPDGRYLAFAAQTGGRDALYIYDLERNRVTKKLEYELGAIMTPSWSPDGRQIAFTGLYGGLSDIYITDLDGNLRRLTNDRYADLFPSWSPDGKTIAVSTDRAGTDFSNLSYSNLRVALLDVETGEFDILPHQEVGKNLNPVWAPDSRSLIWVSDRTGTKDLYLFDRDERQLYRLTRLLSGAMGPTATDLSPVLSWARNDGRLLFVYFESAGHSVFALDDPRTLERVAISEVPASEGGLPIAGAGKKPEEPRAPDLAQAPGATSPHGTGAGVGTTAETAVEADSMAERVATTSFYRQGMEFRPSDQLPEGVNAPPPVSVLAMLDSADYALPDVADFDIGDYKVRFTPDIVGRPTIGAQVGGYYGNGVYGGSYIALSDVLGNHNILLAGSVNGSFSDATFYGGYNFLKRRANFGVALSQVPLYRYYGTNYYTLPIDGQNDLVLANRFLRDVYRTAEGIVSYPFSTFRRAELGLAAASIQRDWVFRGNNLTRGEPVDERISVTGAKFLQPSAALVFDNTYFGWTGPIIGRRYRIQLSSTIGDFRFNEALVDFRNYLNFKQKAILATQFLALTRLGSDADNFSNYWGGPYFLRGYDGGSYSEAECSGDLGGGSSSVVYCPERNQLIGSSAAMMRTELRVPVIKELQIGFLGNFPPVDAVAFFDAGLAWDNELCISGEPNGLGDCVASEDVKLVWQREPGQDPMLYRQPLFSYGVGLRINVFYTVLRLDYAFPLNRPDRKGKFSLSFGPSF